MTTAWQPFYSGHKSDTLADLEGMLIPDPDALDGFISYVVFVPPPVNGPSYYSFSLTSGSPLDPTEVRPTQYGGASRWLRINLSGGSTPFGGPPTTIRPDDVPADGVSMMASRSDHTHGIDNDVPVPIGSPLQEGTSKAFARADHVHTADAPDVSYDPSDPENWDPEPNTVQEALDELAARTGSSAILTWGNKSLKGDDKESIAVPLDGSDPDPIGPCYLVPGFDGLGAPKDPVAYHVPTKGKLDLLRLHNRIGGAGAGTLKYTLRVNGVPSALTLTTPAVATDGSDLAHSVSVNAGDLVDLKVDPAGTVSASPTDIVCSVRWTAA